MKITTGYLKKLIREELDNMMGEESGTPTIKQMDFFRSDKYTLEYKITFDSPVMLDSSTEPQSFVEGSADTSQEAGRWVLRIAEQSMPGFGTPGSEQRDSQFMSMGGYWSGWLSRRHSGLPKIPAEEFARAWADQRVTVNEKDEFKIDGKSDKMSHWDYESHSKRSPHSTFKRDSRRLKGGE